MLDELLELGSMFDWISPVLSFGQDIANGPSHTFMIPQDCGWTGGEIAGLLRKRGVKTWGHMIVNGQIMITVRASQYEFAQYLLDQAGLVTGAEPAASSRKRGRGQEGPSVTETKERHNSLGDLLREIGNIRL